MKIAVKLFAVLCGILAILLLVQTNKMKQLIPDTLYVPEGSKASVSSLSPLGDYSVSRLTLDAKAESKNSVLFRLYRIIPVKSSHIEHISDTAVILGGCPIGIHLNASDPDETSSVNSQASGIDGIGIMTFYDPKEHLFASLGHSIDTAGGNTQYAPNLGSILEASIYDIERGTEQDSGCLCGTFQHSRWGTVLSNQDSGVYGRLSAAAYEGRPIEVGMKQDIVIGKAQLVTTLDGNVPQTFDISISGLRYNTSPNFKITVTDPALLAKTGGVVKGMSGSPIIQNGRLIGAVGYVETGAPTVGYGVFADTMLQTMMELRQTSAAIE